MTHEQIIEQWKKRAEDAKDRVFRFFRRLRTQPVEQVDQLAKAIHEEVFAAVRCIECTNCCRTLKAQFQPHDIRAASAFLGLTEADFIRKFLEKDPQNNWVSNALPCPLLDENGFCEIYEVRPAGCRGYPHTGHGNFARRSWGLTEDTDTCPAVFAVLERMIARLEA